MNDREKVLAASVAVLIALWGATQGWGKYQAALEQNLNIQRNVAQQLSTARTATARGRRAQQKLRQWSRQSLPTDRDLAQSLYQDWLQQELTSAGLEVKDVNIRSPRSSSKSYQQFTFSVDASGSLDQLIGFLYKFYQARHLHRISKAGFVPTDDRKAVKISLTIDAMSLEEGDREDRLAEGTNDQLKRSLDQFREAIVSRNLFAVYAPKTAAEPVAAKSDKKDNEASQAKVSGINYGQDGWQMSVHIKKSGKTFYFREGDTIEIGQFKGTVEQLDGDQRRAIVLSDDGRKQVRLGQTLAEAQPIGEKPS